MLDYLHARPENQPVNLERKLRLLACACCRRVWRWLPDERSRRAVETAERYADGLVSTKELEIAWEAATEAAWEVGEEPPDRFLMTAAMAAGKDGWTASWACQVISWHVANTTATAEEWDRARDEERACQSVLFHDIFGNPFRPIAVDPLWRKDEVLRLAQAIYEEQAFGRMAELAAALEVVGCADAAIFEHCRRRGRHVRGCWALDAILARE